jgi:lauroyl/myristoyl acyltransferase
VRSLRDLETGWRARPVNYNRSVWALILALDRLPFPWGEEILARCFTARAFVKTARLRQALAWAAPRRRTKWARWQLARSLCSSHGRFVARSALVGIHDVETLHTHVTVRGAQHLPGAGRAAILLGFHMGPANSYLALRVAGFDVTWLGGPGASGAWAPPIRERLRSSRPDLLLTEAGWSAGHLLYQARRILLDGGRVFISGDGLGREAFSVPLPGGGASIRSGWLTLRRTSAAPVLPVLSHMEGRSHVVTIHPALPPPIADPVLDLDSCRRPIGELLSDYVHRFPEQCYHLAFRSALHRAPPER